MVQAIACGDVHCVSITSTSGTRNGGFHQWVPSARSRLLRPCMIAVIGITDVLLARIVSARTWRSISREQLLLERQVFQHRLDDVIGVAHRLGKIGTGRARASTRILIVAEIAQVRRDARFHRVEIVRRPCR